MDFKIVLVLTAIVLGLLSSMIGTKKAFKLFGKFLLILVIGILILYFLFF